MPNSLHINLDAPLEWRALMISERFCMSIEKARAACQDTDKKRNEFRNFFQGKNTDYTRPDATFDCMTLTIDEIVATIVKMVELRKLF